MRDARLHGRGVYRYPDCLPVLAYAAIVGSMKPTCKELLDRSAPRSVIFTGDVTVTDVAPLVAAGAVVVREPGEEIRWHVLADPEGNEFCAFTG